MLPEPLEIPLDAVIDKTTPTEEPVPFSITNISGSSVTRVIPATFSPANPDSASALLRRAGATLKVSHTETGKGAGKRVRSLVRFDSLPADGAGVKRQISTYIVFDRPSSIGSSDEDLNQVAATQLVWLRAFMTYQNIAAVIDRQI